MIKRPSVYPLLHRVVAEFVENRGGGRAGGGGEDIECACIAILALLELSYPPKSSSTPPSSSDMDYALSTVATYSDSSLTSLLSLLPSFIEKATAAVGTVFYDPTFAIGKAELLLIRFNASKATAAIEKTKAKWKSKLASASKLEESEANAEMAAQLREAQEELEEQQKKEKLQHAAEKETLADMMASQDTASSEEAARLAKIREEKQAERDRDTRDQIATLMKMLADLKGVVVEGVSQLQDGQARIIEMSADTQELVEKSTGKVSAPIEGLWTTRTNLARSCARPSSRPPRFRRPHAS
jgi:hypothetical protein